MYFPQLSLEQIGEILILIVFWGGAVFNLLHWNTAKNFLKMKVFTNNPSLILFIAILWQLSGASLILFPSTLQIGCFLLILFTILSNLQFYQFWRMEGLERYTNGICFLSNLGVIGGLLLIWAHALGLKSPLNLKIIGFLH